MSSDSPTSLSSAQRRLLEQRLRERAAKPEGIPRAPREQPLPLSFGQERLWLLHHLEPGNAAYNSAYLYRVRGPLRPAVLARALVEIVNRHECLRTTITLTGDEPRQAVTNAVELKLDLTPASSFEEALRQARATALAPFDLKRDGLLRPHLFALGVDDHLLLFVAHHSAWDAWSTQIFWRELGALYAAFAADPLQASPLPALAVQYADFAVWQRARLQGPTLDRLLAFWRGQLADAPPLELPADRPRPAELTYAGRVVEFTWPADLRDALHALARAEGASLFMVLLAGWSTLLHRLGGQDVVVTGTAVAGRARRELEGLIGFFVNTLALRTDCGGDPTWRELLQRVRATTLAAYDHDELPFEKLVADLRVPRDPGRHPVFQTALVLHNAPPPEPALAGVTVETLPRVAEHARFDLALTLTDTAAGLRGSLEFSTDLFDEATVRRWLDHLATLLRAVVAQPDIRIDALPVLTAAERDHLLGAWSGAPAPYPREATVHELFSAQARATPEAIALVEGSTQLTYAELEARSDALAYELGDVAGKFVAIELERSIAFVVAVLAVLKAGAAYVPLLKDLPVARRQFIFEDTKAVALICAAPAAGEVPADVRLIDVASAHLPPRSRAVPPPQRRELSSATAPAYVMYTSGSTGRPKGVVLPHRGIVRLVRGRTPSLYGPGQRFLLLASTAFDASTFEMWAPLLSGGTLAVFPDRWPEFATLARAVRENRITHLFLTAGLFNQVIDHAPEMLADVTHLFTGGEAMSARHAARVCELFPALRVTNCYGPTEITTYTVSHELAPGETFPGGSVPIGRPSPNARAYVLDVRGEPQPTGVPGELFLGGDGLAVGYLNLPEMTAERFVVDPFTMDPAARMYRTGDRARWRVDGVLEFLGRVDDQVKIRGFRIEPGEIDAVLSQHPDVRDAAVIAREDQPGELRLVGYIVPRAGHAVEPAALRAYLAGRLPDYMVPAAIVRLPHLPLTPNGKIDRRALPAPEAVAALDDRAPAPIAPRTPSEELLANVWRTALPGVRAGVHDNFFALGGHSLLAMQATAKLGAALGRDVPLRWWFEHPTIAALAERLDRERGPGVAPAIPPIARDGDLPLSHEEQRLWFLHHAGPDPATYHVAWGWRVRGPLDLERLRAALGIVMARHEILRTGFVARDGRPARVIAAACAVPLSVEDPARPAGAGGDLVLQRRLSADARQPFTLDRPPLWRVVALRAGADDHLLAFIAHHLVCDEWSLPCLHAELAIAYCGDAGTLAPLRVQYADYAAWQRRRVAGAEDLQAARAFWREYLRDAPAAVTFPLVRPRPASPTGAGRRAYFPLERRAADALEQLARAEQTTPFVVWLAAGVTLLARWTGQLDLVIGTPLAQRQLADVQPLIGFFLNTLPLRVRAAAGASFRTLIRELRGRVREAFAHGELPLDEIVAGHRGGRNAAGGALFNVMFVLHDNTPVVFHLPGLTTEPLDLATGTAKTDFTLFVDRRPGGEPCGSIEYSTDTLTPSAIDWAIWEFQQVVAAVAADPDAVAIAATLVEETPAPAPVGEAAGAPAPARPELERELLAIWRRVLRRDGLGVHENFFDLGGHSLLAMQLVHEVRQQLGRPVSLAQLLAAPTIAGLAAALAPDASALPAPAGAWKGTGHGTPFFYVPGMNGVEFLPAAVGQRIAADRRWFDALQHPGVDGDAPPARSLLKIAGDLVRQIRAVQPHGPYALGGFCHGGLVAYEVAHQLEQQGEIVTALVLWDTFPIEGRRWRGVGRTLGFVGKKLKGAGAGRFLADRARWVGHRLALALQTAWRAVRAGLPGERGRNEARMIAAGMQARRQYVPGVFRGPVLLIRSRDERVFTERLPQDGWAGTMLGRSEVIDLPHWHFHLLREPAVSELADRTAAFLRKVDCR